MPKRKKRNADPDPGDDPKLLGELWRSQMRDDVEGLPSLAWKRVQRTQAVDMADPRQASAMQVYRVLAELMALCGAADEPGDDPGVNVSPLELEAFLDGAAARVFRRKKGGGA